jgi:hypothetical protein
VLFDAYDAKEACAECLPDVGHEWDAMVMVRDGNFTEVPSDIKDLIETLYKGYPSSPFGERKRLPKDWQKRLADFDNVCLRATR